MFRITILVLLIDWRSCSISAAAVVVGGPAVIETASEATEDGVAAPKDAAADSNTTEVDAASHGAAVATAPQGTAVQAAVEAEQEADKHRLALQQSVREMLKQIESDSSTLTVLSVVEQIKEQSSYTNIKFI